MASELTRRNFVLTIGAAAAAAAAPPVRLPSTPVREQEFDAADLVWKSATEGTISHAIEEIDPIPLRVDLLDEKGRSVATCATCFDRRLVEFAKEVPTSDPFAARQVRDQVSYFCRQAYFPSVRAGHRITAYRMRCDGIIPLDRTGPLLETVSNDGDITLVDLGLVIS